MKIGMLWYDPDQKATREEKIAKALAYYRSKYGKEPTIVYTHPGEEAQVDGVKVEGNRAVLGNHLWIGVQAA